MELHVFDVNTLKKDSKILIVGGKHSGKTTLASAIILENIIKKDTYVFTNTHETKFYANTTVHTGDYDDNILGELFESPKTIVFDDVDVNKCKNYRTLMFNGRHMNMSSITICKNPCVPPPIRNQFNYVFFGMHKTTQIRKMIQTRYFPDMPFEQFNELYDRYTEYYGFLVLENATDNLYQFRINIRV